MVTRYSFTRFDTAEQCAHKFWRRYVLGEKGPKTDPLLLGTVVHSTLEAAGRAIVAAQHVGALDLPKLLKLYAAKYVETYTGQGAADVFEQGEQMITDWHARTGAVDYRRFASIEERFDLVLPSGVRVMGFIDLIERAEDGTITVVDYKSSRALPSRQDMDRSMQLGIYALAARQRYPDAPIRLCFDMLRHGLRLYTERTSAQLDTLERYLSALASRVEGWADNGAVYTPTLNRFCHWCSFKAVCPAYQGALEVGELGELCPDSLDDIATERTRLVQVEKIVKSRRAELDGVIRDYVKQDGHINAGGMRFELVKTRGTKYQPEQAGQVLGQLLGIEPAQALQMVATVDKTKLSKVLKQVDDESAAMIAQAELDAGAKVTHSSRLTAKEVSR